MGVSHDFKGDSWGCVPRSLFWREDLDGDREHGLLVVIGKRWFYATRNYSKVIGCNWEKIPFGLRRGGLRTGEEGTSSSPPVE
ncbi:hypothetical protein Tco_0393650, partial [Tanacetum coccineum]